MSIREKPRLPFAQVWNMCFGFMGIQFAFALQNGNMSRIFQTLGADMSSLPILWIAAPLTGLLVQPLVGHTSDRTWTRLGRRRPYFLAGAILTALALFVLPNSPVLWMAVVMLWLLDASINVTMEPFRAYVGDALPSAQRTQGYALQTFFIGVGGVAGSLLPELLARAGVANVAPPGELPDTLKYGFAIGAAVVLACVGWTVLRGREYSPTELAAFSDAEPPAALAPRPPARRGSVLPEALAFGLPGLAILLAVALLRLQQDLYVLGGGLLAYALLLLATDGGRRGGLAGAIVADMRAMPPMMRRLALVQFFTWLALFAMWIYTTAAVTSVHFGSSDPASAAYNAGANWVGVMFAVYGGFSALVAFAIPPLARRFGLRATHVACLWIGAVALLSMRWIEDPRWLLLPMLGVGVAWAAILSVPYALLSEVLPASKMGVYMGIFNFFIVLPQLLAASVLGFLVGRVFDGQPMQALVLGGICFFVAGLCTLRVTEPQARTRVAHA